MVGGRGFVPMLVWNGWGRLVAVVCLFLVVIFSLFVKLGCVVLMLFQAIL